MMANPSDFTPELEQICRERSAEYGEPPCYELPKLVSPCEHITPCDDCLADQALTEGRIGKKGKNNDQTERA